MTNRASIQSHVYRGYGQAAKRLGDQYQFYRYGSVNRQQNEDGSGQLNEDGSSQLNENNGSVISQALNEDGTALLNEDGTNLLNESSTVTAPRTSSNRELNEDGSFAGNEDGTTLSNEQANLLGASPLVNPSISTSFISLNAEDMKYSKPNKYGKPTWYALFDATGAEVGDYFVGPQGTFFIATLQPLLPILVVECNRVIDVIKPQTTTGAGIQPYSGNTATNQVTVMSQWPASILQGTKGEKTDAKLPGDTRAPWWLILLPFCEGIIIEFGDIINDDLSRSYTVSSAEKSDAGWRITAMQNVT